METDNGKRAAYCDFTLEADKRRFFELLQDADIFTNSYLNMEDKGISPRRLADARPGIIAHEIRCFDFEGEWSNFRGFDMMAVTATGYVASEGAIDAPQMPIQVILADYLAAYVGAAAIAATLLRRSREGGAGQGLGRAIATLLARRGATVYMADLQPEIVERAASELTAEGLRAIPSHTDVADEAQLHRLRDEITGAAGRLDVLVNNAGGWRYETIREVTPANWDWTFRVNLLSMFLASRTFMDMMIAQRYGRIVNISSTDAYRPKPTLPWVSAGRALDASASAPR